MLKKLEDYRGVILLVIVCVFMLNMIAKRVDQLNRINNTQINLNEKR